MSKANDANTDWNGFLFRLNKTRFFIWIDHNDSPTVCSIKCYFICIGFALLWNFFLIELRSFRFLNTIFLLLVSTQTYTETILNCLHLKHLTFQLFPGIASPYSQVVTRFPLTGITYLRITCCMVRLVVLPFLGVPMLTTGYPPRLFSLTTQQQLIGCDLFPNTAHIFSFVFPDFRKKGLSSRISNFLSNLF